jgi:hypothetical protein
MADYIIAKAQEGWDALVARPWITISVVVILALLVHL